MEAKRGLRQWDKKKNMYKHFTEEARQITYKHMNRCTILFKNKMQIKATIREQIGKY